jgi:hypothetical protein
MQDRTLSAFVVKERKSVSEKAATSKSAGRPRSRNTAAIIKAAKDAGATSVTFPDGTVVSLTPPAPSADRSATEVDRWFEANAS